MKFSSTHAATAAVLLYPAGAYSIAASASSCCDSLKAAGLEARISYPESTQYEIRQNLYWSINNQLNPWCIVQPEDTAEVASALKALVDTENCKFAVRSGGHTPYTGANNINEGVTIDLGNMNSTTYHPENSTASLQPGARWGQVYAELDKIGIAVPGGRAATVGVAGLITGGGNSFYSAKKGFVCDNIVRFEVVLASGETILADKDNHSDLFVALKGGSTNFGIVTRFDIEAFASTKIWGGVVSYPRVAGPQLLQAMTKFADNVENNPSSSSIIFWTYVPPLQDSLIIAAYENVDGQVEAPAFEEYLKVDPVLASTLRLTNMTDLAYELEQPLGYDNIWYSLSFKNDVRVMEKAVELHDAMVEEMKVLSDTGDFTTLCMFQPLPTILGKQSEGRTGNVLGLDRLEDNAIMFLAALSVKGADQAVIAQQKVAAWVKAVKEYAASIDADVDYIFLNYADGTHQSPLASYGAENVAKIRAAAAKYDPKGIFQTQVPGGFKISKVPETKSVKDEL